MWTKRSVNTATALRMQSRPDRTRDRAPAGLSLKRYVNQRQEKVMGIGEIKEGLQNVRNGRQPFFTAGGFPNMTTKPCYRQRRRLWCSEDYPPGSQEWRRANDSLTAMERMQLSSSQRPQTSSGGRPGRLRQPPHP